MAYESEASLKIYLREISQTPLLTAEEEISLAEKIKNGDEKAREHMIRANLRLVVKIAQDYANYGVPVLDLISEGNMGLMKAVDKFDPNKGGKLSTYGAWWIKQSIKRALANQSKTVRLPVHMVDKVAKMRRIETQLTTELGREATDEEISEVTGIPERKIRVLRNASQRTISLDAPVNDGEARTYGEMISDEGAENPFDMLSGKNMQGELEELLKVLKPREKEIIERRFRLNGYTRELTLEEVGAEFSVTRERIRQIQNQALGKMRRALQRKEKQPQQVSHQGKTSSRVADIISTLSSQSTLKEAWSLLENSEISFDMREKGLRNISVAKGLNWYSLGVRAIRELRKGQEGNHAHRKVTYADVETFLRATVFVGKNTTN